LIEFRTIGWANITEETPSNGHVGRVATRVKGVSSEKNKVTTAVFRANSNVTHDFYHFPELASEKTC